MRAAEERLHIDFPAALREWYMLAGKRMDVWSCQDTFLAPDRLRVEENRLIIYVENQSVVTWSIPLNLLAEDDPLVYVSDAQGRNEWIGQSCVSTFALIQMLLATKFSGHAQYTANGQANDRMLASIAQTLQRLDFPDLSFPAYPTRLYAKNDLIVEIDADTWIWVSAKSDETFRAVIDGLSNRGASWEQVTED